MPYILSKGIYLNSSFSERQKDEKLFLTSNQLSILSSAKYIFDLFAKELVQLEGRTVIKLNVERYFWPEVLLHGQIIEKVKKILDEEKLDWEVEMGQQLLWPEDKHDNENWYREVKFY